MQYANRGRHCARARRAARRRVARARHGGGNDTSAKLRKAVTVDGHRAPQAAFSLAALATGGNRLAGHARARLLG